MKTLIPLSIQEFDGQDIYRASRHRPVEHISQAEFAERFPPGSEQPIVVAAVARGLDGWYLVVDNVEADRE